jgi:hypothetical protein
MLNSSDVVVIGSPSTTLRQAMRKYFCSWDNFFRLNDSRLVLPSGSCGTILSNSGFVRGIIFIAKLVFTNVIQKDRRYER